MFSGSRLGQRLQMVARLGSVAGHPTAEQRTQIVSGSHTSAEEEVHLTGDMSACMLASHAFVLSDLEKTYGEYVRL